MMKCGTSTVAKISALGLAIFLIAGFFSISHQAVANFFYFLCAIPALIWASGQREHVINWLRQTWTLWLLLGSVVLGAIISGNNEDIKPCFYILLVGLVTLTLYSLESKWRELPFTVFALTAVSMLAIATFLWLKGYYSFDEFPRVLLWGSKQPLNMALLIVFALVWIWEFKAEPLLKEQKKLIYWIIATCYFLVVVLSVMPFQARSALLGFACYLVLKVWLNDRRVHLIIGLTVVAFSIWITGLDVILYERGLSYRPQIWMDALQRIQDCGVIFGCGNDHHLFAGHWTHAHSAYIMEFYKYGLIVMVPFTLFVIKFFKDGIACKSKWMLVAAVGWGGVMTTTGGVITSYKPFWVYFWIPTLMALIECWRYKMAMSKDSQDEPAW